MHLPRLQRVCTPAAARPLAAAVRPLTTARPARCAAGPPSGAPAAGGPPPGADRDYKVALITGANTGIGYITALRLAEQNYRVVLGCRDTAKAEAARARIREAVPQNTAGVEVATFDLANLSSVHAWASRAQDFGHPLDCLILNAGVMACPEMRTADGFEYQLGVNHLGHFLLAGMLAPLMVRTGRPARVVSLASAAHLGGHINFDDLQSERSYSPWPAYAQSKLANVLFAYEFDRRLPADSGVTVNALHPGVVATDLGRYLLPEKPAWWQVPLIAGLKAVTLTPEAGAATSIYLASSPEVEGVSGKYYDACKPVPSSKESYDRGVAERLWEVSAELVEGAGPSIGEGLRRGLAVLDGAKAPAAV